MLGYVLLDQNDGSSNNVTSTDTSEEATEVGSAAKENIYPEYPNNIQDLIDSQVKARGFVILSASTSDSSPSYVLKNAKDNTLIRIASNPSIPYSAQVVSCKSTDASTCEKILNSVKFTES